MSELGSSTHAVDALRQAVTFRTVAGNVEEFEKLHDSLKSFFPLVFERCEHLAVPGTCAVLLKLKGRSSEKPVLLTAHQDVVPADNESDWTHAPFGGSLVASDSSSWVWGRGSFDDKVSLISILASLEGLLADGFVPENDLYFGFGDDEEVMGHGAADICKVLTERGVKLDMVVDEGGAVMKDFLPGMKGLVGAIGVAEKGSMAVKLTVRSEGGHSSTPDNPGPVARLGKAVWACENARFPVKWLSCVENMVTLMSDELEGLLGFATKHNRSFRRLVSKALCSIPKLAPFIRTSCVATMANGSDAFNVIPKECHAILNIRMLPGQNSEQVLQILRKAVNDPQVDFEVVLERAPSSIISDSKGPQFGLVSSVLEQVYGDIKVIPYLMVGASDAFHYEKICSNILRISPVCMTTEELGRMHGNDERISVDNVAKACRFYTALMKKL